MISRNIKSKYGRSLIGLGWTILSPIVLSLIYYIVFKKIMQVKMEYYLPFILSGVIPWSFFAQSLVEGMESIVANEALISKIPIPLQVLPFVNIATNFITLLASLPIICIASLLSGVALGFSIIWSLYFYFIIFLIVYSLCIFFSVAYVFFRDLKHMMSLFLQFWMFATPVIYSFEMIPSQYHIFMYFNPMAYPILGLHHIFTQGTPPLPSAIFLSAFWAITLTGLSTIFMRYQLKNIVEFL